jgi:hypothetical protein
LLSKRGLHGSQRIYAVTISIVAPYSRWSLLKSRRRALPTEVNIQYPEFPVPAFIAKCRLRCPSDLGKRVSHLPATSRADLRATDPTARVRARRRYRDQAIANSSKPWLPRSLSTRCSPRLVFECSCFQRFRWPWRARSQCHSLLYRQGRAGMVRSATSATTVKVSDAPPTMTLSRRGASLPILFTALPYQFLNSYHVSNRILTKIRGLQCVI